MLKDIKNVMNSKRLNSDSNVSHALVQDTRTGEVYDVNTDSEFLFGRFLKSSIVIEELYISRSHSTIRYADDKFLLKDNNSHTGTYLNYKKITKEVVLQNGDLIAFTDKSKTWDFVYKFCLLSNPNKKHRLEEGNSTAKDHNKFKNSVEHLENQIKELKLARAVIINDFKAQMEEFKKSFETATELNNKLRDSNQESINELAIYRRRCMLQKELLDTQIAKEEESVETFKTKVFNILENDFQCAICNEVVVRPSIANCAHTFCDKCLKSWLVRSNQCPTCRSVVVSTTYSLPLDNYITNLCDFLGGTIKEQRLALLSERSGHHPQMARRGRRRAANQSGRGRREPPTYDLIDDNSARNNSRYANGLQGVIEIVDLTNSTSR